MKRFKHKFVNIVPDNLEEDILYISTEYKTAIHICPCGCGSEVATPLSPHDWKLTFDGDSVSLYPSVGSWGLPCQSHYWITNNLIEWAPKWSREQINQGRTEDKESKKLYHNKKKHWSLFNFFKN
ncbi:hypothetical protein EPO17_00380 [Patescibacteria group bacterium]|nr:MAG: hypothetical protein EPO17_00380 [Patescibacteria group bacterium]